MNDFFTMPTPERQRLIEEVLQNHPDGGLFHVTIFKHSWGREDLFIEPKDARDQTYKFYVMDVDDKLRNRLSIAADAIKVDRDKRPGKIDYRVCCPLAKREFCVCEIRYTCRLHGGGCIGSHD